MSTVQEETKALFRRAGAGQLGTVGPQHPAVAFCCSTGGSRVARGHDRQLRALDPTGRQMVISCGCALFNARVGLAADRVVQVDRLPDPRNRTCLLDSPCLMSPPLGRRWSG